MGNPRGFLQIRRYKAPARPVHERLQDWNEFEGPPPLNTLQDQASRCMDCGIPFCHKSCPLGNLIPDWNDLVYRGRLDEALDALESTNNFPEVTSRVCPAPCEASCVLNIEGVPVTIKDVEHALADHAFSRPLIPRLAPLRRDRSVAVVGSGPAGLAAAQQLAREGYAVSVFERSDRIGGLLRYGIPDYKLDRRVLDRRIEQMIAEGIIFRTGVEVGRDITAEWLLKRFDAVILCIGARKARPLRVPGAKLRGVHFAMEFLEQQNRRIAGDSIPPEVALLATGKRVVILGGGDTGSDCLGTSLRQGALSVTQLELMPRPPEERLPENPWPEWPLVLRTSSSQEEGGERDFAVKTTGLLGDERGHVRALEAARVELVDGVLREIPGSAFEIPCDLVLLAMGFIGVEESPLLQQFGLTLSPRGTLPAQASERVLAAGDAVRGASLVVWAIAEGRRVADLVHRTLQSAQAAQ
ncbi:MAG: glutamate synthase subunit beta [Myxococcales bacterium]|nr:glutamate synthase subunit beta [Polyangiaceae bacterium]MDW8248834.1 glutamate synthase subunit beta [Myxococcales bacterium]